MTFDLPQIVRIITVFQIGLICLFLLVHKDRRSLRNIMLAVSIGSKAMFVLGDLLDSQGVALVGHAPWLLFLGNGFQLLLGPAMFFALAATTNREYRLRTIHTLHLLPFLLVQGFILTQFHFQDAHTRLQLLQQGFPWSMPWIKPLSFGIYCHFTVYGVSSLVMLSRRREDLLRLTSESLGWWIAALKFLVCDFIVVWGANMAAMFLNIGASGWMVLQLGTYFNIFLIANSLVYLGLRFPAIFGDEALARQKYERTLLSPDERKRYGSMVTSYMATQKPYLDPTLSLTGLAGRLAMPAHVLSQVLNGVFGQNFSDYVNSYRIEECKRLLTNANNGPTVLEVLYECGFNSKSAFNAAFKKFTGMTPREFKRISLVPAPSSSESLVS